MGESFFVPVTDKAQKLNTQVSISRIKRKMSANFVTRAVDGGLRVWRI